MHHSPFVIQESKIVIVTHVLTSMKLAHDAAVTAGARRGDRHAARARDYTFIFLLQNEQ